MCGIAGVLNRDVRRTASAQRVAGMCEVIFHRGPDDGGVFVDGPVGLGMRRLSIIDLAGGHQPMASPDGRYTVVFNGEIYNHREVRRRLEGQGRRFHTSSDTEVILHAYAAYGPECLPLLNGMFAIALWDSVERTLFLARDRVGIKPLYILETPDQLLFASEIKALLAAGGVGQELNADALRYFLRYGYVPSSASLLSGVRQLLPGHFMLIGAEHTVTRPYWSVTYDDERGRSDEEWAELVATEIRAAVDRQLVSDVPLGAFLSGGLDSASLVALMTSVTGGPVNTYSIGFEGVDSFHSELADARAIAERFGTRHHEIVVKPDVATLVPRLVYHLDQPLADSSFLVTYLVSTLARETVKVIISGVGGDEVFGGYRRYLGPRLAATYGRVPAPVRRLVAQAAGRVSVDRGSALGNLARLGRTFITGAELAPFEQYDHAVQMLPDAAVDGLCPGLGGHADLIGERRQIFDAAGARDPVTPLLHLDLRTSLVDSLLLLTDKMTMATSLEARVPYLDHELIELAARVPADLKVKGSTLRYIQKRAMQPYLPAEVFDRKKRGFGCPVGRWFRADLRELLRDTLAPGTLRRDGLFDPDVVAAVIDDHEQRREDRSETLLALLTFHIWRDQLREAGTLAPAGLAAGASR